MKDIKIEKGVPVGTFARNGQWRELAEKMQDGDSIVIPSKSITAIRLYIDASGFKCVTRKVDAEHHRLWKIKAD